MFLHQLRAEFKKSLPVSEGFFRLMKSNFGFYAQLCNQFYSSLGQKIEQNGLHGYLQEEIRPKLFDEEVCKGIEPLKKAFLGEIIKLEQFLPHHPQALAKLNDLAALKGIADSIYELLQSHWEFYKYQKSVANDRLLVAFIQEIERIGICWDSYVEKYLAATHILGFAETAPAAPGLATVKVYFHLPQAQGFGLDQAGQVTALLGLAYEFASEVMGKKPEALRPLEVLTFEAAQPVHFTLVLPQDTAEPFARLIDYLSIDVIKRETLVKFVMEVVQQQQSQELPKPVLNNYLKRFTKTIEALPANSHLSVDPQETRDSVAILSQLVGELERMKVEYKDLLSGPERRLSRNRLTNVMAGSTGPGALSSPGSAANGSTTSAQPTTSPSPSAQPDPEPLSGSTVKISIAKKEHHGFLTS
ncbi:MAG: hypothetical protein A2600_03640 [Candidatus Lambdaproteobacteria bacterium RIFOXYD1_FULL_56_27]|uniref:Uncharacterized protein n=1 Tax=Candidatus Lambdaproteobacteria bacterium RIFOXYD2_FULL_56_26 TaxID=1817773 RepID=A0A1F6H392_9PROT|nr:MAG: hypothetical protein A2426_11700 [Candidatus Lambdaproteobacteria bacterium RIFOXYC1_FULL_56_13]OGH04858.1 MAG: hypothetical protein A2557_07705 [Candidatus Lambdaproteobacteria bacterium RIFOXYD2_FULL_56_26]OGH09323.1 MAG: hypothetical protein A2600_03640 [Candidatus Lambdaproteobacteria bacterium RIFOXYD1_FULL_56_27]